MPEERPFTREYVIYVTNRHMISQIDRSIRKTTARVSEFANNLEKSQEILETLSILHGMKRVLVDNSKNLRKSK